MIARSPILNPVRPLVRAATVTAMWMILTGASGGLLLGGSAPRFALSVQILIVIFPGLFFCFFIEQVFSTAPPAGKTWDGILGLWEE